MTDWCVFVQDRLWRAHDAAGCPAMRRMWLSKIRAYLRKQGVNYDEFSDPNSGLRRDNGAGVVLFNRKRGLKQ
jgi:ribosomal protein L20